MEEGIIEDSDLVPLVDEAAEGEGEGGIEEAVGLAL